MKKEVKKGVNVANNVTIPAEVNSNVPEQLTPEQVLTNAMNAKNVTPEQLAQIKQIAALSFANDVNSEFEIACLRYVANLKVKALNNAKVEAEAEKTKAQREAEHKQKVQEFEIGLFATFSDFLNVQLNELNKMEGVKKLSLDTIKGTFKNFIENLPKEPKMEGRKVSNSARKETDAKVNKSESNEFLTELIKNNAKLPADQQLTRKQIGEQFKEKYPDYSQNTINIKLQKIYSSLK